ncbi:hypothetical protein ICW40_15505 [Actinotalea ferrariae]|uniref:hypothetical protein n=1 Tax=Actinotalea ferrariae TaxID=1386098 RepID=UPI001C8C9B9D|nr:hypothetical protein [Actinotalea ferrariae]MBX9246204.1 hypothetical protein [Actinotalea ferrariae]
MALDVAVVGRDSDAGTVEEREREATHARAGAVAVYDSAARRAAFAADLEANGVDRDLVATRLRADISQGKPATEATRATRREPATATRGAAQVNARQRGRSPR